MLGVLHDRIIARATTRRRAKDWRIHEDMECSTTHEKTTEPPLMPAQWSTSRRDTQEVKFNQNAIRSMKKYVKCTGKILLDPGLLSSPRQEPPSHQCIMSVAAALAKDLWRGTNPFAIQNPSRTTYWRSPKQRIHFWYKRNLWHDKIDATTNHIARSKALHIFYRPGTRWYRHRPNVTRWILASIPEIHLHCGRKPIVTFEVTDPTGMSGNTRHNDSPCRRP